MPCKPTPFFALADCNNFYASCERAFNPQLEGKPIVILSNNDGCIIARSNEAKKLNIPMGAPFFKWEKICIENQVSVFSSNYELYGDVSHRVMTLLSQYTPNMEIYSIDEAFLLLDNFVNEEDIFNYSIHMRNEIKQGTGIPISIGLAPTKTLAKLANYIAKSHTTTGVYLLNDENISILQQIPVGKIWGVGRNIAEKLHAINIHTVNDLKNADAKLLRSKFSVNMEKIIYELRGQSCLSLESVQARKQIISSRSFGKSVTTLSDLEEAVSHYTSTASLKLRNQNSLASGISVFLQNNTFNNDERLQYENSQFLPFPTPTCDTGYMIQVAKKCIRKLYKKGYKYHKAGIILFDLVPKSIQQFDLLDTQADKKHLLMQTMDTINQMYGRETIFHCAEGIKRSWQIKSNKRSPRYTTRWDEILKVR